jgi:cytochrome d ubiquinol oxidase subunit I
METLDALAIARIQFALNIGVHILFPSVTIALAWMLVWFRVQYARTGEASWMANYKRWTKIFALSFAMGVVTGIVMSFQFGTNWPGYMNRVGNVAGPLLAYEVLTAFFLEATFLSIMLFGINRVSNAWHIAATILVAFGTTLSAFWILALNSWMQTPAGYLISDGKILAENWWAVIFNPSFPYRFVHMLLASMLSTAFLVAGLSAWRLLRESTDKGATQTLRAGIICAAFLAPLQILAGDQHGLNTLQHQPAKVAAIEALWHTQSRAPLVLFALPDADARENAYAIELPAVASVILKHSPNAEIRGLAEFAPDIPPVALVFFAFRVMVGVGVVMLLVSWFGAFRLRRAQPPSRRLLWLFASFTFSGWIALIAGWIVTESGRQPWLVTGILRTRDAAGTVAEAQLGASLTSYLITYAILLLAYVVVLTHLAAGAGESDKSLAVPSLLK